MPNDAGKPGDREAAGQADADKADADKADADEAAAFAEAVRGARKLAGARRVAPVVGVRGTIAGARRRQVSVAPAKPSPQQSSQSSPSEPVEETGEIWSARADGVDRRVFRKLRDGGIPIEARLDLHGLTRARAVAALARFIAASRGAGRRCLLVVHGRGLHSRAEGAPLRDLVRHELTAGTQAGTILACGSAAPAQGGVGAALVYLRR